MPESLVQVTEGSGKKLHTWQRTVGANNVEDEFTLPGEYPLPTFSAVSASASIAGANTYLLWLGNGASTYLRIRRIRLEQLTNVTGAAATSIALVRTTTSVPAGGSAITIGAFDTADTSAATAKQLPTPGTEGQELIRTAMVWRQAVLATGAQMDDAWEWVQLPNQKPIIIPPGATNGIAIKNLTAMAAGTAHAYIEWVETTFAG